jgi:LysW-gamma-L-lysine carboxypeptidase
MNTPTAPTAPTVSGRPSRRFATPDDAFAERLITDMVSTPSLSGEEHNVAALLVSRMRELGLDAEIDEAGNAVGIAPHTP